MGIITKFIVKGICEKKLRSFLIILAIVLSSGVFFASIAISGSLEQMIIKGIRDSIGNADIIITPSEKSSSPYFYMDKAELYKDRAEYMIGELQENAVYKPNRNEEISINMTGASIEDVQKMNPFTIKQQYNLYPFEGRKIIIGESAAEKYQLKVGDSLDLEFVQGGTTSKQRFTICGIASSTGLFKGNTKSASAIVPRDFLSNYSNARGKVGAIYIKLLKPEDKQEMIELLSNDYNNYKVFELFPLEEIKQETMMISAVFLMLSSIVFFMSIFIIYSSFKVITTEKLPIIGTFRSIGATKRMTNYLLLGESIIFGIVGGLLGCGVGVGILYLMSYALSKMVNGSEGMEFNATIQFSGVNFVLAFLMAIILCFVSSIIPILKVSKIPIKDIVLNSVQKNTKRRRLWTILGIVFMVIAFVSSLIESDNLRPILGSVGMLLTLTAIVMLVPNLTSAFVRVFETLYIFVFGNIGILAAKNLRENQNIINNISMLAIGIACLLLINTASYDNVISITDQFKNVSYDIEMYMDKADRNIENRLLSIDGVKEVYGDYEAYRVEIADKNDRISRIKGVDKSKILDFWNINMEGDIQAEFERLDEGRNILITNTLKEKLNLNEGDLIKLKMKSGEKDYKVIGFFDDFATNKNIGLVSQRFLKADMQLKYYSDIFIKTSQNPEDVLKKIETEFIRLKPYLVTKNELQEEYMSSNQQVTLLMSGFSVLAIIIGVFGVLNNLLISFLVRKRSLAVFRSMGMSKVQTVKMIFIEAITGGAIGGLLGVMAGTLMIVILAGTNNSKDIHFPFSSYIIYVLAGVTLMLMASIIPALKSSKLDIVSSIKLE
ncbi:ABC transporter permease [Desulfosporosinus lacus]|uniref:Putative ABC transport system permease protein n=1 Tax=Desulfosporosinus lacus DSM 15449 TaxID=1121420 RepID=A0A1M5ZKE4_9FIRM|nr:FtsX-like permease family protein [Desulfosporosinus lacus]SHI24628.1 putative ABC transport system permease protein [Desulfosporosinus lacus DSM 15449]